MHLQHPDSFSLPEQQGALTAGEVYRSVEHGIVVRVENITDGHDGNAVILVCRASNKNESQGGNSCLDGLDNDCDGLVVRLNRLRCNLLRHMSAPRMKDLVRNSKCMHTAHSTANSCLVIALDTALESTSLMRALWALEDA